MLAVCPLFFEAARGTDSKTRSRNRVCVQSIPTLSPAIFSFFFSDRCPLLCETSLDTCAFFKSFPSRPRPRVSGTPTRRFTVQCFRRDTRADLLFEEKIFLPDTSTYSADVLPVLSRKAEAVCSRSPLLASTSSSRCFLSASHLDKISPTPLLLSKARYGVAYLPFPAVRASLRGAPPKIVFFFRVVWFFFFFFLGFT